MFEQKAPPPPRQILPMAIQNCFTRRTGTRFQAGTLTFVRISHVLQTGRTAAHLKMFQKLMIGKSMKTNENHHFGKPADGNHGVDDSGVIPGGPPRGHFYLHWNQCPSPPTVNGEKIQMGGGFPPGVGFPKFQPVANPVELGQSAFSGGQGTFSPLE
jgi:hypothetical protein